MPPPDPGDSMAVELRHFRSFIVVAEEAHFGRAAQRLYLSQPALTRQVQQLEEEVGVGLLRRTARGVELTDAGAEMVDRARTLLQAAENALAVGESGDPQGDFRLGVAVDAVNDEWLGLLRDFAARYPRLLVETRHAYSELLQRQVITGEIDAAVVLAPLHEVSLSYSLLQHVRLSVWLHPDDERVGRQSLTLADLAGSTIALVHEDERLPSGFNRAVRDLFAASGVEVSFRETLEIVPGRILNTRSTVAVSPDAGFGPEVVRVRLLPRATLPFELVRREGVRTHAAQALIEYTRQRLDASGA